MTKSSFFLAISESEKEDFFLFLSFLENQKKDITKEITKHLICFYYDQKKLPSFKEKFVNISAFFSKEKGILLKNFSTLEAFKDSLTKDHSFPLLEKLMKKYPLDQNKIIVDASFGLGIDAAFFLQKKYPLITLESSFPIFLATQFHYYLYQHQWPNWKGHYYQNSNTFLFPLETQLIYFDPFFIKKKKALPKFPMQNLYLWGDFFEQKELEEALSYFLNYADVCVKRGHKTPILLPSKRSYCLESKLVRLDIYKKNLPSYKKG